jgi:hypothetical protein
MSRSTYVVESEPGPVNLGIAAKPHMRSNFPRAVSYHEAGHAVAFLRLVPYGLDYVRVAHHGQRTITDQRGRKQSCGGLYEGSFFNLHQPVISCSRVELESMGCVAWGNIVGRDSLMRTWSSTWRVRTAKRGIGIARCRP